VTYLAFLLVLYAKSALSSATSISQSLSAEQAVPVTSPRITTVSIVGDVAHCAKLRALTCALNFTTRAVISLPEHCESK
jgi:hypothetical protein